MNYIRGQNPTPMEPWEFMNFLIRWARRKYPYRQDHEDFASWAYLHTDQFTSKNRNAKFLHGTYLSEFEPRKGVKVIKDISSKRVQLFNKDGKPRNIPELIYEIQDPINPIIFYGDLPYRNLVRLYVEAGFTANELMKLKQTYHTNINRNLNKAMEYLRRRHAET